MAVSFCQKVLTIEFSSFSSSSDSEGQFETPEAETPVHQPYKEPPAQDQPITESTGKRRPQEKRAIDTDSRCHRAPVTACASILLMQCDVAMATKGKYVSMWLCVIF